MKPNNVALVFFPQNKSREKGFNLEFYVNKFT